MNWADPQPINRWHGWVELLLDPPLRFVLVRHEDESGVSTEQGAQPGQVVAWGLTFPDGTTVTRWCVSEIRQTCVFASIADVQAIHGHGGKTEVRWLDSRESLLDELAPEKESDDA